MLDEDVHLLFVCTANICRSPSAAAFVADSGLPVQVRSAGTAAVPGVGNCRLAPLMAGHDHLSQPLTEADVQWADLVLTAAREHQRRVLDLAPAARDRTFTITQAGRLAAWLLDSGALDVDAPAQHFPGDDPRSQVVPMTGDPSWLVGELNAARGLAPAEPAPSRGRRGPQTHPDDIPDPHVLGTGWHGPAAEQIQAGLRPLLELIGRMGDR